MGYFSEQVVIEAEDLGITLEKLMEDICNETTEKVFEMVDEAVEQCDKTARQYLYKGHGVKTGDYRQHFAIEKKTLSKRHRKGTWYVEDPEYRLTHLIEKGHRIYGTAKKTRAIKHIEYGREIAEQVIEERLAKL